MIDSPVRMMMDICDVIFIIVIFLVLADVSVLLTVHLMRFVLSVF